MWFRYSTVLGPAKFWFRCHLAGCHAFTFIDAFAPGTGEVIASEGVFSFVFALFIINSVTKTAVTAPSKLKQARPKQINTKHDCTHFSPKPNNGKVSWAGRWLPRIDLEQYFVEWLNPATSQSTDLAASVRRKLKAEDAVTPVVIRKPKERKVHFGPCSKTNKLQLNLVQIGPWVNHPGFETETAGEADARGTKRKR